MKAGAQGRVVFVGAGPGASDLITVRGAQRLAQADVVLFDALTGPALRELARRAQWLDVGKRGFCDSTGQSGRPRLVTLGAGAMRVAEFKTQATAPKTLAAEHSSARDMAPAP